MGRSRAEKQAENATNVEPKGEEGDEKTPRRAPIEYSIRRQTEDGALEKCFSFDPETQEKREKFTSADLGRGFRHVPQIWGGGRYNIRGYQGGRMRREANKEWELPARDAYHGRPVPEAAPDPVAPPPPSPAPFDPNSYFQGIQAQAEVNRLNAESQRTWFEQALTSQEERSSRQLRQEREEHQQRLERDAQFAEQMIARQNAMFQSMSQNSSADTGLSDRLEELGAQIEEAAAGEWQSEAVKKIGDIVESITPILAQIAAAKMTGGKSD